jgi:hypothetical protein
VAVGDASECQGVGGIDGDGAGEHLQGELKRLVPELVDELPAAQVVLIRLDIGSRRSLDGAFFFFNDTVES